MRDCTARIFIQPYRAKQETREGDPKTAWGDKEVPVGALVVNGRMICRIFLFLELKVTLRSILIGSHLTKRGTDKITWGLLSIIGHRAAEANTCATSQATCVKH